MESIVSSLIEKNLKRTAAVVLTQGADVVKVRSGVDLSATKWEAADLEKLNKLEAELAQDTDRQATVLDLLQAADAKDARRREIELANSEHAPWYNKSITSILAVATVALVFIMFGGSIWITTRCASSSPLEAAQTRLDSLLVAKKADTSHVKANELAAQIDFAVRSVETAKLVVDTKNTQKSTQKEIILYVLGVLSAALTQVYSYYFGSSRGSARKDETIAKMTT